MVSEPLYAIAVGKYSLFAGTAANADSAFASNVCTKTNGA